MLNATPEILALLRWHGVAGSHRGSGGWLIWLIPEIVVVGALVWALTGSKRNAA